MKWSVNIFRLFGIQLKIHLTFLLLPLFFLYHAGIKGLVGLVGVYFWVISHEFCHSLQARRYGIKVRNITLYPIGGIASIQGIPDNPKEEFIISISGPLFNFISAAILFLPAWLILGPNLLTLPFPWWDSWKKVLVFFFWMNPILGAFNLLPAFPMDGGRVLRAFLAEKIDYRRATKIAVSFGHAFAFIFCLYGLIQGNMILVIIGIFIYTAASQEETQVNFRMGLKGYEVKDILQDKFISLETDTPLSGVVEIVFHSHQEDFPVVEDGKLVGLLTRSEIISTIHQHGLEKKVSEIMKKNFPVLSPHTTLVRAHHLMAESNLRAIPVVYGQKIYGVITLEDISRAYMISGSVGN